MDSSVTMETSSLDELLLHGMPPPSPDHALNANWACNGCSRWGRSIRNKAKFLSNLIVLCSKIASYVSSEWNSQKWGFSGTYLTLNRGNEASKGLHLSLPVRGMGHDDIVWKKNKKHNNYHDTFCLYKWSRIQRRKSPEHFFETIIKEVVKFQGRVVA